VLEPILVHLTIYRCFALFGWPLYPCLVIHACLVEYGVWSDSSPEIAIWLIVGAWFSNYIFAGITLCDTFTLLNEYAKELAQEGLFVEPRSAPAGHSRLGGDAIYLYLYPLNCTSETAHTLSNSGNGSIVQRGGGTMA
jgi:hypothetical protein